jgi:hypothetical protein
MAIINFKNEAEVTRIGAATAIAVITLSLGLLSIAGAIATSSGDWGMWIIRIAFATLIAGAEALAAFALVRVMLAANLFRKIVGSIIFIGLAWVCVQNAKAGVHAIFPDRFAASSSELAAESQLASEEADQMELAASAAAAATPQELERVRKQIADLRVEQKTMASQSPEKIKEAQSLLLAQGKYYGSVDGIRQDKTEAAMRARGEEIQGELAVLNEREAALTSGAPVPIQTATTIRKLDEIALKAKAEAAYWSGIWLEVMLWVMEGARSFGLWVFVTSITATGNSRVRELEDSIRLAGLEAELARVRAPATEAAKPQEPGPVVGADEYVERVEEAISSDPTNDTPDEDPAVTEESSLTPAQRRARKGGQASQHARRADRNQKKIPVTDDRADDEMFLSVEDAV